MHCKTCIQIINIDKNQISFIYIALNHNHIASMVFRNYTVNELMNCNALNAYVNAR